MDYEKINPCGTERYVRAVRWSETECWCCTATRALLVGVCAGVVVGLAIAGAWGAALITGAILAPLVVTALVVARRIWRESYSSEDGPND